MDYGWHGARFLMRTKPNQTKQIIHIPPTFEYHLIVQFLSMSEKKSVHTNIDLATSRATLSGNCSLFICNNSEE